MITELLDLDRWPTAPGQGALAIEVRADVDGPLKDALEALDHRPTRLAVTAERALLQRLEAGCAAPIGASAVLTGTTLRLDAVVARPDGTATLRRGSSVTAETEDDARRLGTLLADELLEHGAADLADLGASR